MINIIGDYMRKLYTIILSCLLFGAIFSLGPIFGAQYTSFGSNTYRFYDGTYQWIEISGTGTEITGWSGSTDDGYKLIDLPFQFPFYSQSFNRIYVSTNGHIDFAQGSGNTAYNSGGNKIPTASGNSWAENPMIAALLFDLDLYSKGKVYYQNFGNYFVIEYYQVPLHNKESTSHHTFEIILYNTGNIKIQYKDLTDDKGPNSYKAVIGLCLDAMTGISYDGDIPIQKTQALWFSKGVNPEKKPLPIERIMKIIKENQEK